MAVDVHSISIPLFHHLPLDIAIRNQQYDMIKLLRDFIKAWFTENDESSHHPNNNRKLDHPNLASFQPNAAKHSMQNHDQFDEEDDS